MMSCIYGRQSHTLIVSLTSAINYLSNITDTLNNKTFCSAILRWYVHVCVTFCYLRMLVKPLIFEQTKIFSGFQQTLMFGEPVDEISSWNQCQQNEINWVWVDLLSASVLCAVGEITLTSFLQRSITCDRSLRLTLLMFSLSIFSMLFRSLGKCTVWVSI